MAEKQIVIPLSELGRVEVICPKCKSGVTFASDENAHFPTKCSVCGETLAVGIANIGSAWKEFLREAKTATIQFRVKV
jgi:ribosomal protein S27E